MKKLLEGKYSRVLELAEESGKIRMQDISNGDLKQLQKELKAAGYDSYIDDSTDYLIIEKESTLDVKQTIKNLIGIEVTESFKNEVICAFDTTEKEVIVNRDESNANIDYQAYENLEGAPIICIKIEDNKITDAWEA